MWCVPPGGGGGEGGGYDDVQGGSVIVYHYEAYVMKMIGSKLYFTSLVLICFSYKAYMFTLQELSIALQGKTY